MKKLLVYSLSLFMFAILFFSIASADVIPGNSHPLDRCVKIVNLDKFPDMYLIAYITGPMVDKYETYIIKKDECLSKGYKFNQLKILAVKKSYLDSIGIDNFNPFKKILKKDIKLNKNLNCYYDSSDENSPCLDNIEDWQEEVLSDKNVFVSDEEINPYGGYIDQNDSLIKEEINYSIAKFSDGKLVLYKSQQISEYNDGTPKKIETFDNSSNNNSSNDSDDNELNDQNSQLNKTIPVPVENLDASLPSPELIKIEPIKRNFWQSIVCFFQKLFTGSCQ
ncbi:hypothetical protein K8R66_01810 [bacterium]|nr:hypothetical protein [bacterium]